MFTAIGVLTATAFAVILRGWVLTQLWTWFIIPTFGLPALGIAPAIGLALILQYLIGTKSDNSESDFGKIVLQGILSAGFFLVFGWLISFFM